MSSKIARFAKTDQNKRITGGHSKTVSLNISVPCKGEIISTKPDSSSIIHTDYPVIPPPVFNVPEIIFTIVMIFRKSWFFFSRKKLTTETAKAFGRRFIRAKVGGFLVRSTLTVQFECNFLIRTL